MQNRFPTLLIGEAQCAEFRETAEWLAGRGAEVAANVAAAVDFIRNGFSPAVIVLAQPWPGHVSVKQVEDLRRAAPLARIVGLMGTWLEGERRTGKPWPAATRSYWHQWIARNARDWEKEFTGLPPSTADENETVDQEISRSDRENPAYPLFCVVHARHRESAEAFADICGDQRWETFWIRNPETMLAGDIDVVIFDAVNGSSEEKGQLAALKTGLPETPTIVTVGFPRQGDVEAWKAAGADAIISKPFLADDLIWQVNQLVSSQMHFV
jgi:hypothetical protein